MGTSNNVVEENNANSDLSKNDYKNHHNKNFREKSLVRHLQIFSINDLAILTKSQQLKVNIEESVCCCQNTMENPSEDMSMSATQETPVLKLDIEPIRCDEEDCENAVQEEHFESIADHPAQPSTPESETTAAATSATLGRSPQGKAALSYQCGCHKDRGRGSLLTVGTHIYFKLAFWVCVLTSLVDPSKAEPLNSSYGLQQCDVPESDLVFQQDCYWSFYSFDYLTSDRLHSTLFWCTCVVVGIVMAISKRLFFKMCRFIKKLLEEIRLYCHQSPDIQQLDTEEDTYKSQYTPSPPIEASQSTPNADIEDENQKRRETHTLVSPTHLQVISPEPVPADSSSSSSNVSIKPPGADVGKDPSTLLNLSIQESSGDNKAASLIVSLDGTHSMEIFNHPPAESVRIPSYLFMSSPQSSSSISSQVPVAKEWGISIALNVKTFNCVVEPSSSSTELSFSDTSGVTAAEAVLPSRRCPYTFH